MAHRRSTCGSSWLCLGHGPGNGGNIARQAKEAGEGYQGFLLALASRELEQRQANQIQRRLRTARFPRLKTLETTDLNKWPALDAVQVRDYAECDYITRCENVVLLGKHGTGKTHAATVLGVEACRRGYRVGFTTAAGLVNTLIESREERQLKRQLAKLSRFELLIVDEVGYLPFSAEGRPVAVSGLLGPLREGFPRS